MRRAVGLRWKIDQERGRVGLPRDDAEGVDVDLGVRVGVTRVPAGDPGVVVEDVADVPAEDDVAEAEARLEHAPELLERDVFAAQHAVDVEPADLDLLDAALGECGAEILRVHRGLLGTKKDG